MTDNGLLRDSDFLVLGGTGKTGRRVVEGLRERGLGVRVASRSAEGGRQRFVWEEDTWGPALAGVGAVYLVPPGELTSPELVSAYGRSRRAPWLPGCGAWCCCRRARRRR